MVNEKKFRIVNFIMCLTVIAFMMPVEAVAMDNPTNGYIEEFPVPGNPDTVIAENNGTINFAKSPGTISYNFFCINNLEGATVGENKYSATIDKFNAGRVENNYGTINKVNNTASVGINAPSGVIWENFNNVDKNMGMIDKQYTGTISENYGNVGTIGASATIERLYEGTITENSGSVVIYPAPEGILTQVEIGANKGSVKIEADAEGKSSVAIDSNETGATLYVCRGADCTVTNNAGKIVIEDGGTCNIGTNSGTVTTPADEYTYKLILDNINPSDINFVDFYRKDGGDIYVKGTGQDCNVIVTYDTNMYFCSNAFKMNAGMCISIENTDYSILDDTNHTFTIHFHTTGEYEHSFSEEKHVRKCGGNWKGSKCTATYKEDCSIIPATCTSNKKCSKCGEEYVGTMLPHPYSWVRGNGKHKQVCSECNHTINAGACSYGEWIIDSEAKVGVTGKKHRVCSVCGDVDNATIPAIAGKGNKKPGDNEQGGNESGKSTTKNETAQVANSTKMSNTKVANVLSDNGAVQEADNTNYSEQANTDSNRSDEEMKNVDSVDSVSGSEPVIGDLESSGQETDETEGREDGVSGKSKIAIIVGVAVFATAAAAVCFVFYRKKGGKGFG